MIVFTAPASSRVSARTAIGLMYARRSNESATSSAPSTDTSARSRTFPRSVIAGGRRLQRPRLSIVGQAGLPLTSKPSLNSGKLLLQLSSSRGFWDGIDLNLTVTEFNIVHLMVF